VSEPHVPKELRDFLRDNDAEIGHNASRPRATRWWCTMYPATGKQSWVEGQGATPETAMRRAAKKKEEDA